MRREANFQTLFRHWFKEHQQEFKSGAFELKQTTTDSLPFSACAEHQIFALQAVQQVNAGLLYKAPDDSRGVKPFDFFFLRDAESWVVVRYPKFFCVIDTGYFTDERDWGDRKSLTSERAKQIARYVVPIK